LNSKLAWVVIIVVIAIIASFGAYYYSITTHKSTSATSLSYPGYVSTNDISQELGGQWTVLNNESGYITINHNDNTITIIYLNGTKVTNPATNYPSVYSNSFYNHTLLESATLYYQTNNKSNEIMIEVIKSDLSGVQILSQDLEIMSSLYNLSINRMGNVTYISSNTSLMAVDNNYLIVLATVTNYNNKMLGLLNLTIKTLS
jgi:hypothetical protein